MSSIPAMPETDETSVVETEVDDTLEGFRKALLRKTKKELVELLIEVSQENDLLKEALVEKEVAESPKTVETTSPKELLKRALKLRIEDQTTWESLQVKNPRAGMLTLWFERDLYFQNKEKYGGIMNKLAERARSLGYSAVFQPTHLQITR